MGWIWMSILYKQFEENIFIPRALWLHGRTNLSESAIAAVFCTADREGIEQALRTREKMTAVWTKSRALKLMRYGVTGILWDHENRSSQIYHRPLMIFQSKLSYKCCKIVIETFNPFNSRGPVHIYESGFSQCAKSSPMNHHCLKDTLQCSCGKVPKLGVQNKNYIFNFLSSFRESPSHLPA